MTYSCKEYVSLGCRGVMARILLIGGHGKVALRLSGILSGRGDELTSVFCNPDHSGDVRATDADPVVADIGEISREDVALVAAGRLADDTTVEFNNGGVPITEALGPMPWRVRRNINWRPATATGPVATWPSSASGTNPGSRRPTSPRVRPGPGCC